MAQAYEAVAKINGRPAGWVGIFLSKDDYRPYPSSPAVTWKRVQIEDDVAALMRTGKTFAEAVRALKIDAEK